MEPIKENIEICYDKDNDYKTLEHQVAKVNDLEKLNRILERTESDEASMIEFMANNKTESALILFETEETITIPEYIKKAVAYVSQ